MSVIGCDLCSNLPLAARLRCHPEWEKLICLARLDYDSREDLREGVRRMRFMLYGLPTVINYTFTMRRHRTRKGWHVEIYSTLTLAPAEVVALQAILNSDYKREAFNLFRVSRLYLAPPFWHALPNWNVLHSEKITK